MLNTSFPVPGSHPLDIANPAYRDRTFFLGDTVFASGGARTPRYNPGLAYFCSACGVIWGRVILGPGSWHAVSIPCVSHGGGSFLQPLIWWDHANGRSYEAQLTSFPADVLRYEAKIRASSSWKGRLT